MGKQDNDDLTEVSLPWIRLYAPHQATPGKEEGGMAWMVIMTLHTSLVCTSFGGIYFMYWVIS